MKRKWKKSKILLFIFKTSTTSAVAVTARDFHAVKTAVSTVNVISARTYVAFNMMITFFHKILLLPKLIWSIEIVYPKNS